jgi:hypothetical protein
MIFAEFAAAPMRRLPRFFPRLLPAPLPPGRRPPRRKLTAAEIGPRVEAPGAPRASVICARKPEPPPRCLGGRLYWRDSLTVCCAPR